MVAIGVRADMTRVRDMVLKADAELATDNVFKLELGNGSRIAANSDFIRSIVASIFCILALS
jgi:hypothetical protein